MSERRKTRKRKRIEYVIGIGFLIGVFGIGIYKLRLSSKKISEEDHRGLQNKPELSVSAVTSGSYMDQYEKNQACILYKYPSTRDRQKFRMPSSA